MSDDTLVSRAQTSLERIQNFDTSVFNRPSRGRLVKFKDAIPDADRLVFLFRKIPIESLSIFPDEQLSQIQKQADIVYHIFEKVLSFELRVLDSPQSREDLIEEINDSYQLVFTQLMPLITYIAAEGGSFKKLEAEAESVLTKITEESNAIRKEARSSQLEVANLNVKASKTLKQIDQIAIEQGVGQKAVYFKKEAEYHTNEAERWGYRTLFWACTLIMVAVINFAYTLSWNTDSLYSIINLTTTKALIFGVLAYMLILSSRNLLSHKHNAVVNKHRQNSLSTFRALVEAGQTKETQAIVLSHAAYCIFSMQDTGYSKHGGNQGEMSKVVDLIPKSTVRMNES